MCARHSTPCWGVKSMLISNCLSNIRLITSDFSQHAPRQRWDWGMKQRQVHVLLRWLRLWGIRERERERERDSVQSLSHLQGICIGTVGFRNPYKYSLPAISSHILQTSNGYDEENLSQLDRLFCFVYVTERLFICSKNFGISFIRWKKNAVDIFYFLFLRWLSQSFRAFTVGVSLVVRECGSVMVLRFFLLYYI